MIELEPVDVKPEMIDFGHKGKVLFQLPVLGAKGVPLGLMTAFSMFWEKYQSGRSLTEREVSAAWNFLVQTMADTYPDATRQVAMLDEDNLKLVLSEWVRQSGEQGFDAGKA